MGEWKKIGEVAMIRRGASPRPISDPKFFGGTVGWVRIVDVTRSNRFLRKTDQYLSPLGVSCSVRVGPGDLIMSICGTVGRPVIVDMDACIHDGFVQFYNLDGINSLFLFYSLSNSQKAFQGMGQPGTQVNLNTSLVGRKRILVPPLPQQRRIAEILSTVDEAIERTEQLIAKQRQIKAGLMADLFTRGVTPDGKLRPPRQIVPHLYKQSPLGWIPKEWEVRELRECIQVFSGDSLSASERLPGDCLVYGGNGPTGFHETYNFEKPQLIIGRVGELCGNVFITEPHSWVTDNALVVKLHNPEDDIQFWHILLTHLDLNKFAYSAAQPVITGGQLKRIRIALPSKNERLTIHAMTNEIRGFESISLDALSKLKKQKQGLMHDLLTGRKTINQTS